MLWLHKKTLPRLCTVVLQCISKTDDPRKCAALRDDYLECLHHRKEVNIDLCSA